MQYFRCLIVCILTACILAGCSAGKGGSEKTVLRVMTYNIHHGEGVDGKVDIERIAKLIKESNVDIVALQEVDRGVERTNKVDIMGLLTDMTDLTYAFGKNIDFQGGASGNGVLTRFPIHEERNLHYTMIREGEQRGLLQLVLDVRGQEIVLMNTHIDYREDDSERVMNVEEIREAAKHFSPRPVIVCGDFNDIPTSQPIDSMKHDFTDSWEAVGSGDGFSYPTDKPVKRIDYIFISKLQSGTAARLRPISTRVLQSNASDHLPVIVEFEIVHN